MTPPVLRTERLLLRQWRPTDAEPWAALNADPEVMEHFPSTLDRQGSDAFMERVATDLKTRGWGWFAVEVAGEADFVGSVALVPVNFDAPFGPAVEVGWRLARASWGCGYATEAASELLRFAFEDLGLDELVSFTATTNGASEAVMRRIGMLPDEDMPSFEHPSLPEGHCLRQHVLYRLNADQWRAVRDAGISPRLGARESDRSRGCSSHSPGPPAPEEPG